MSLEESTTSIPPRRKSGIRPSNRFAFMFDFPAQDRWRPGAQFRKGTRPSERETDLRAAAKRWSVRLFESPSVEGDLAAGTTFFGQFIAHDLSFDARPGLRADPEPILNRRSSDLGLDSVYGIDPIATPQYYEAADPRLFAIGTNGGSAGTRPSRPEPDLLRSSDRSTDWELTDALRRRRTAIIPDPRNDENVVVSQLHLAFQLFHNRVVRDTDCTFDEARRAVRHAYHRILLSDFLEPLCGPDIVDDVRNARTFRHFRRRGFVPFEFSMACFRFGHSMIGESYHLNDDLEERRQGHALRFTREDLDENRDRDRMAHSHLDGGRVLPLRWTVQWDRFLPSTTTPDRAQRAQRIDLAISTPLSGLPLRVDDPIERSLPYRTLLRGSQMGLPTGHFVAERVLGSGHALKQLVPEEPDPLWIYVLREAAAIPVRNGRLGPVAARIVVEVCLGLLLDDPDNGLNIGSPEPVVSLGDEPHLIDLIEYAGLPISRDDWEIQVVGENRI